MNNSIFLDPKTKSPLQEWTDTDQSVSYLKNNEGTDYLIENDIPNLIFPPTLESAEKNSLSFYEGRADQYENTLHLTFKTHGIDEIATRKSFIEKLKIKPESKILEIACGTGRDSILIADELSLQGELHLQDISKDMLRVCKKKLSGNPCISSFVLANALYLPYPDGYFDGVYSFGALGEFSDKKKALKEMVRVTKNGGRVVVGDESVPEWLRDTDYFKILKATNPMFEEQIPLYAIPIEARNTSIHYVIGQSFYLIEFEVGQGEPTANFDFTIPGTRGGSYRTRHEGQLEGVSKEAYNKAWKAVKSSKSNMHDWLSSLILKETKGLQKYE